MSDHHGKRRYRKKSLTPVFILLLATVLTGAVLQLKWISKRTKSKSPTQRVSCGTCNGWGIHTDELTPGKAGGCTSCYGVGTRLIRPTTERPIICPSCGGMGRLVDFDSNKARQCRRCDGWGVVAKVPPPDLDKAPLGQPGVPQAPPRSLPESSTK